jgi:hypothetical protein
LAGPATRIGRYQILGELGHGGNGGPVSRARRRSRRIRTTLRIKTIHDQLTREREFVDMFLDEARLAARIHHPNAVSVYEVGEEDGRYYIAMDYVNGETLAHTVNRLRRKSEPVPIGLAVHVNANTHKSNQSSADVERFMKALFPDRFEQRHEIATRAASGISIRERSPSAPTPSTTFPRTRAVPKKRPRTEKRHRLLRLSQHRAEARCCSVQGQRSCSPRSRSTP